MSARMTLAIFELVLLVSSGLFLLALVVLIRNTPREDRVTVETHNRLLKFPQEPVGLGRRWWGRKAPGLLQGTMPARTQTCHHGHGRAYHVVLSRPGSGLAEYLVMVMCPTCGGLFYGLKP